MSQAELDAVLQNPATAIFSWRVAGEDEGLLELDFSEPESCEIKYFGVSESQQGTGAARALMNHAIETAFARSVQRLWLHTNTIDHPRALAFYQRSGFVPIGQAWRSPTIRASTARCRAMPRPMSRSSTDHSVHQALAAAR